MKKTAFLITMLSLALFAGAQSYKDISDKLLLRQYKQAKEDLDKKWSNAKFVSKPEAYILKTAIYAALSTDTTTGQSEQLLNEAEAAFATYRQMDAPNLELMSDLVYKEGPVNLYSSLFSKGYKQYRASDWQNASETFKKVVELSDLLAEKKVLGSIDTTSILLAGYTAENAGQKDDAFKYYSRLAENKVAGDGNEFLYRFLMIRSYEKGDIASFDKYKAMGKQYYPNSEYFDYDQTDFAVGLSNSFDAKVKALDEVLAKDPNSYKANITMAQIIFDTLHPKEGVPPAKTDELEAKMVSALEKAGAAKPDDELIYLVLGDHYIDKADKANEARTAHVEDMKKRTKPGTQPSKTDIEKRDALDKEYGVAFDKAREPYEKAAAILAQKKEKEGKLSASQQQQYKKVAGYLGDIYNYKRSQAKGNAADIAKYTAEAKKWNDLYDSLRNN